MSEHADLGESMDCGKFVSSSFKETIFCVRVTMAGVISETYAFAE